jgi:putative restriction endonuclease
VLEAAHTRPYSQLGPRAVDKGLLLRSDLHTLFDRGYVTVTPDLTVRIRGRIREEFENGRDYYALDRQQLISPLADNPPPSRDHLQWHTDTIFRR